MVPLASRPMRDLVLTLLVGAVLIEAALILFIIIKINSGNRRTAPE